MLELDAGVVGGELPVHAGPGGGALGGLLAGLLLDDRRLMHPLAQALSGQHAQLALGDVQPRAVLGRVNQLNPVGDSQCLSR